MAARRRAGAAMGSQPVCPWWLPYPGKDLQSVRLLPTWPVVTADLFNCDFMPQHVE
jgi:hypothetical protein